MKLNEFNFTKFPPSTCPIDPKSHLQKATLDELAQFAALGVNYQVLVGSLNYLAILTRPDIAYSISKLSQFLEQPGISHFRAAVQVFRYLHHTKSLGLLFRYLATLNHHIISWKSCKQSTVSLFSTEAEYKALSDAGKEASWLINLCQEIFEESPVKTAIIEVDNRGAINLARSQVSQNGFRTKHMDLRLHHIRDLIGAKTISLKYVASASNSSDFLTKPVGQSKITRSLQSHTSTALNIGASHPTVPSMGACQDVVMGPPSESNFKYRPKPNQARKPCCYQLRLMFIPAYHPKDDAFIADAINQPRPSHDTTSTQTLEVPDA
ncbi:hypothetical protein PCASD_25222 [Puccinia coronata f. sp. avenae]|uniref:Reverse transcriptase Ty1/copia-type domain-containing protein n=1 Tax=Puccinia coronata f. sp. avenae TaxID=200324 RepID=A0A2N5TLP1_9BASI|nr:hypothetical protein PCASD_25222 [Puccinia coronata f. sp. avenae]